jgi:hypothetical protein
MFDAITNYIQSVENTRLPRNPKKNYEDFKKIEERIKDEIH